MEKEMCPTKCNLCGKTLHARQRLYQFGQQWVCGNCLVSMMRHADADELADVMGLPVKQVGNPYDWEASRTLTAVRCW